MALVLFSRASLPSRWPRAQWEDALVTQPAAEGMRIAFVKCDDCVPPRVLVPLFEVNALRAIKRWVRGHSPPPYSGAPRDADLEVLGIAIADRPGSESVAGDSGSSRAEQFIHAYEQDFDAILPVECGERSLAALTGDLAATVRPGLAGVIVPDCESPQDVRAVADKLDALEQRSGLSPGGISIIPLPETALGIRRYYDILAASPRVRAAWFAGTPGGDLARDVGYSVGAGGTEYLYLRSKVVCDARAAGIGIVIDCAWRALSDDEGFSTDTQRSRDLGYTGRLTFNAAQAAIANAIYGHKESA